MYFLLHMSWDNFSHFTVLSFLMLGLNTVTAVATEFGGFPCVAGFVGWLVFMGCCFCFGFSFSSGEISRHRNAR